MSLRSALAAVFAGVIVSACSNRSEPPASTAPSSGIDVAGMDKSVHPGDAFYEFVNGGWLKVTEIPADKSRYGLFTMLGDETRKRTVAIIQESANAGASATDEARKVGDYYSSFIDEAAIEAKGIGPLKPQLDGISTISDRPMLSRAIGGSLRADVDPLNNTNFETENLFGVWITQGLEDPSHNFPYLLQGGLGMPDREYYLSKDPHMGDVRKQYQSHAAALLKFGGFADADVRAARVFALET